MPELGMPGSVGAAGGQPPAATRPIPEEKFMELNPFPSIIVPMAGFGSGLHPQLLGGMAETHHRGGLDRHRHGHIRHHRWPEPHRPRLPARTQLLEHEVQRAPRRRHVVEPERRGLIRLYRHLRHKVARPTRRQRRRIPLDNPCVTLYRRHLTAGVMTDVRNSANRVVFALLGIVTLFGLFPVTALANPCPNAISGYANGARGYETQEYIGQHGLCQINASDMYARGGTGSGITIGVIDTGLYENWDLWSRSGSGFVWPHRRWGWNNKVTDVDGHGTHVAGIIAARKNNTGIHGVAFNARIESLRFVNEDLANNYLGSGINWLANSRGIRIINHSFGYGCRDDDGDWTGNCLISHFSRSQLYRTERYWSFTCFCYRTRAVGHFRSSVPAYQSFVLKGGVAVYAAGNDNQSQPNVQAGLPLRFPELENGWLAVVAVDWDGGLASYSNECEVAWRWCIAAPGTSILSTDKVSGWDKNVSYSGTSMAAPHVAGALAGLKSMFPNLSYQDVRIRMLISANSTGIYSDWRLYGHGLLDLYAASRPIGGTFFAHGRLDDHPVVTTAGGQLTLPAAAVSRYVDGEHILVLDGYQRAPFTVPVSAFVGARGGSLSIEDLDLVVPRLSTSDTNYEQSALMVSGDDYEVGGSSFGGWFLGTGSGAGLMEGFASLRGVPLTHGNYRMSENALGFVSAMSLGAGELRTSIGINPEGARAGDGWGIMGWSPRSVITASFAPKGKSYAIGTSFASNLAKPSGWDGAGAFNLTGDTVDISYGHNIFTSEKVKVVMTGRLTHLSTGTNPMVDIDDASLATADLGLSLKVSRNATLNMRWGIERPLASGKARIRAARAVDENGRLTYKDITMAQADFLEFEKMGLSLRYDPDRNSSYGAGILALRDGFGETEAIVGAKAEVRF